MAKDSLRSIFSGFLVGIYKRDKVYQLLQEHGHSPRLNEEVDKILNKLFDYHLRRNLGDEPYTPIQAKEDFLGLLREYQRETKTRKKKWRYANLLPK